MAVTVGVGRVFKRSCVIISFTPKTAQKLHQTLVLKYNSYTWLLFTQLGGSCVEKLLSGIVGKETILEKYDLTFIMDVETLDIAD